MAKAMRRASKQTRLGLSKNNVGHGISVNCNHGKTWSGGIANCVKQEKVDYKNMLASVNPKPWFSCNLCGAIYVV